MKIRNNNINAETENNIQILTDISDVTDAQPSNSRCSLRRRVGGQPVGRAGRVVPVVRADHQVVFPNVVQQVRQVLTDLIGDPDPVFLE